MLDENQIVQNWNDLEKIIETKFSKERTPKLKAMYAKLQDRMMMAPASGIVHYHNCFAGGYVDHVLRVIDCAKRIDSQWEIMGAEVTHTEEELIFSALNHDLGKVGDMTNDYYIPNPSEWHRKNQGQLYKANPETPFALVPDRSLFLLNQFGIKYSYNEFLGIKLHDGMYDDSNKPYLMSFNGF